MISTITALRTKLYVAKLEDEKLAECSHALMRQLFFPKDENQTRFFSLTRTSQETSLILEEEALADFPPYSLTIVKSQWRALSVSLGSVGYTGTGIVSSLSGMLAKAGISLFYLSTSNTDFILVPESKFESAINALKSSFTIYNEGDFTLDGQLETRVEEPNQSDGVTLATLQQNFLEMSETTEAFKLTPETPPCTILSDELRLCYMSRENREICAYAILKLMFFCPDPGHFWSISETEDEMSLLIPDKYFTYFPADTLNASDVWRPIQRFKKTSYNEVGVVAALSAPIARGRVPLLYVSTFLSAFILVQSKNVSVAVLCLESQKFKVVDKDSKAMQIK